MKISDQVIEEVDEQQTITSMRGYEPRPTAASIFAAAVATVAPLPVSQPMSVPGSGNGAPHYRSEDYTRTQSFVAGGGRDADADSESAYLSTSAPPASNTAAGADGRRSVGDAFEFTIEDIDQAPAGSVPTVSGGTNRASGSTTPTGAQLGKHYL